MHHLARMNPKYVFSRMLKFFWVRRNTIWTFVKKTLLLLYDILGLRFVVEHVYPPLPDDNRRPASTIMIWVVGTYISSLGLATTLYAQQKGNIELQIINLFSKINEANRPFVISRINQLSNTKIPVNPEFINVAGNSVIDSFTSPFRSLFQKNINREIRSLATDIIILNKNELTNAEFIYLDIAGQNLSNSNWKGSKINAGHFDSANLSNSNFDNTIINNVSMHGVVLSKTSFIGAKINGIDISMAKFKGRVDFSDSLIRNSQLAYIDSGTEDGDPFIFTNAVIVDSTITIDTNIPIKSLEDALLLNNVIEFKQDTSFKEEADYLIPVLQTLCMLRSDLEKLKAKLIKYSPKFELLDFSNPKCREVTVFFKRDTNRISKLAAKKLEYVAERLHSGCSVLLQGHVDSNASQEYNIALGERRAKAVAKFLLVLDISITGSKINIISYGESEPLIFTNPVAEENNRVKAIITC